MKLAYCIVAAKIAKITYAILKNGTAFEPNYRRDLEKRKISCSGYDFTISDRKLLRRARNSLRRVNELNNIGMLGEYAVTLADQLEDLLQRKKLSD